MQDVFRKINLALPIIFTSVILYVLLQIVIEEHYPDRELYTGAEYRFENIAGVRSSDFVIKYENHQFLIAPGAPIELKPQIELSALGNYSVSIDAEYPHWLCNDKDLDKATLLIQGGSLNETVKLIRNSTKVLQFTAAKGQRLSFRLSNQLNKDCGRAQLEFHRVSNLLPLKIGIALLWLCLVSLCFFTFSSPYITTLGVLANTSFILAEATLGNLTTAAVLINTGLAIGLTGLLFVFAAIPFRSRLVAFLGTFVVIALMSPALASIAYEMVFSVPLSVEAIHGALQSYGSQAFEFWKEFIGKRRTFYFLVTLMLMYLVMRQINKAQSIKSQALVFGGLLVLISGAATLGKLQDSGVYNLTTKSAIEYRWEIDAFKKVANQRKDFATEANRLDAFSEDTTVVVFGESVNKKHMSAYGYVRKTTPLLDHRVAAGEVVLFENAYASHTHSNPTMSLSLTQADQYASKRWQESPSVFNYAAAAKVETQWLTNHRLLGGWSNNITTIISEADRLQTINYKIGYGHESTHYDSQLVPLFKQAIVKRPNQLTFLHLYNSHSYYCNRYPDEFNRFEGELALVHFGELLSLRRTSEEIINCYDNTIVYTDTVLEQLIAELDARDNPSLLLYVADHAEEFIDGRTHNSAIFSFDMINIPLVVWANDAWREQHSESWEALQNNRSKVFTNDHIFESVLGLAGIRAPEVDAKNDVSSASYSEPSKPLSLYGRVEIDDYKNWNYWQNQNMRFVDAEKLNLVAVDVGSLGEAKKALAMGIKHLQINVGEPQTLTIKSPDLMMFDRTASHEVTNVSKFIEELGPANSNLTPESIWFKTTLPVAEIDERISRLEKRTDIDLRHTPFNQAQPISVARPDFKALVAASKAMELSDPIPVTILSRYTTLAPEPD